MCRPGSSGWGGGVIFPPPTNSHIGLPSKSQCGLLASEKAPLLKVLVISSSFSPFPPGVHGLGHLTRTEFPEPSFPYTGSWGTAGKLNCAEVLVKGNVRGRSILAWARPPATGPGVLLSLVLGQGALPWQAHTDTLGIGTLTTSL